MKGIILAGGENRRLRPVTRVVSKHLLAIYDRPMIYFPLTLLMTAGIRNVTIISSPKHLGAFKELLGDGSAFGVELGYLEQPEPRGIADAFNVARERVSGEPVCLALGDNVFVGEGMDRALREATASLPTSGAVAFGREVSPSQASDYGIAQLDGNHAVVSLEEKPRAPRSNVAVVGVYVFPGDVTERVRSVTPDRGSNELQILDLLRLYVDEPASPLRVHLLDESVLWFDGGTPDGLLRAAQAVAKTVGEFTWIGYPEIAAYRRGWITREGLDERIRQYEGSAYGEQLTRLGRMVVK